MNTITASHILVPTLDKANEILQQLSEGADFAQLAENHSVCPSSKQGGNLGTFRKGLMVKPFEDAAFSLQLNEVSEPIQTQFGYHIIKRFV